MTETAVVYTDAADAAAAARDLADQISKQLTAPPDALVVFASPKYDHALLLRTLKELCPAKHLVGASSAGEFTRDTRGEGLSCALAIRSDSMAFSAGIGRGLDADRRLAAKQIVSSFRKDRSHYPYRSALILTDALAGHADDLVEQLTIATAGGHQFFGGGAGDNAQFKRTTVFYDTEAVTNAAVALEILSEKPVGIGVGHGWQPATEAMRVTEARGSTVVSLNGRPAVQAFRKYAEASGQQLDEDAPFPFFLQNILGIEVGEQHRLRVPLVINTDGSVLCAAVVPEGSLVHIMKTTSQSAIQAASVATSSAVRNLKGHKPKVAFFFDCVATRLRLGDVFGFELQAVAEQLGDASFVGCNSHGQIARAEGQFVGFHNCTAVVCALPE